MRFLVFDDGSLLTRSRRHRSPIYQKLGGAGQNRLSQLKSPLSDKDHKEAIVQLRAFSQWFQFALTVDGCALLSKISSDVLAILTKQSDTFQLLGDIDRWTCSIELSLTNQPRTLRDRRAVDEREKGPGLVVDRQTRTKQP